MTDNDKPEDQEPQAPDQEAQAEAQASDQEAEKISSDSQAESSAFNLQTVIDDARKVITNPVGFYRDMPTHGGFANPIIFVVVIAVATAVIGFVLDLIGLANFNSVTGGGVGFAMLIFFPIAAIIGSFIGGAILFVIWKLMGSEKNFETAYRCVAYSFAIAPIISVLSLIPYIAGIIKTLWGTFLLYTASIEVHKLKQETAKIVFGVLAALGVLFGISSEHAMRKALNWAENIQESFEKQYKDGSIGDALKEFENVDEMTPEEAGKKMGEFLKGMEEFSKGLEESTKEAKD